MIYVERPSGLQNTLKEKEREVKSINREPKTDDTKCCFDDLFTSELAKLGKVR
jgi:hypothetical protein